MSTLMTYDHPYAGPATILIQTPGLPVEITLRENRHERIRAELAGAEANTIQIGPFGTRNRDVQIRAFNEQQNVRQVLTTILPGAVFSQTARVSGKSKVVQCGGDITMGGHGLKNGSYVSAPLGCLFQLKDHGPVTVKFEGEVLTLPEATARELLRLDR